MNVNAIAVGFYLGLFLFTSSNFEKGELGMSRYIDADKLRKNEIARCHCVPCVGSNDYDYKDLDEVLDDVPTADVVEVRHGEWIVITEERDTIFGKAKLQHKECSVCGYPMGVCGSIYCGNCGAKMDGERREENDNSSNERLIREKTALECIVSSARNQAKADTVRKMQERLKAKTHNMYPSIDSYCLSRKAVFITDIDQIVKEMLEEK